MLSSIAIRSLRVASVRSATLLRTPAARTATFTAIRSLSSQPFAVDAPDGDHDLQDVEESIDWAQRVIKVASVKEDADAITEMHEAVFSKQLFAVDSPDGEHDLEDVEEHMVGVEKIINQATVFENPEEVKEQQHLREECTKRMGRMTEHDMGYPP